MSHEPMVEHEVVAEMLADYAQGALDDEQLGRVAAHVAGCARCQRELDHMLEMLGMLTVVAPPAPTVKQTILARAATLSMPATAGPPASSRVSPPNAVPWPRRGSEPPPVFGPSTWSRRWQGRPARLALAAVLVAALVSLSVWNVLLQRAADDSDEVTALIANAEAAYPLTDTSVAPTASGVLFVDAGSDVGALVAHGLPPLAVDQRYQIWLFTAGGDRVSAGLIDVDAEGHARSLFRAPFPLDFYTAVGLSAEPRAGSPAPTTPLALGGWLR